ncbi:MAG: YkgJ family cysteine cluster protein [Chloroflexi bacterium]|nr:YkgJ family cysteine cluster protein [Chloroflexota bacterium]
MSSKEKKVTGKSGPAPLMLEAARQALAEHGENPACWILGANEVAGKVSFLCASPPFLAYYDYGGPLLDLALANNLSLFVHLTSDGPHIEGVAGVSLGFAVPGLVEPSLKVGDTGIPPQFGQMVPVKKQTDSLAAVRSGLAEMLRLGFGRLKAPLAPGWPPSPKMELLVRPDGGLKIGSFDPRITLGKFLGVMSAGAGRAKLTRLRQSAQDCGGCGRCCHDGDIPVTYFDLRGLARTRYAERFAHQPELALAEAQANFTVARPLQPGEPLPLASAPKLLMRKKDGTSAEGKPCLSLDGRGLCSVYAGRPLLCRLYHCARTSPALENLFYSAYYNVEWLGRAVRSGLWQPEEEITLDFLSEQLLAQLASPSALAQVLEEVSSKAPPGAKK